MIIFIAGDYFKVKAGTKIKFDLAYLARWNKSKKKFSNVYYVYGISDYVIVTNEKAKAKGLK